MGKMTSAQTILEELKRVTSELGRTPGKQVFEKLTGIKESDWSGVHWPRWNDLIRDAGLEPNTMQARSDENSLLAQLYEMVGMLSHFPTQPELSLLCRTRPDYPSKNTFRNVLGPKNQMIQRLKDWATERHPEDPIIDLLIVSEVNAISASPEAMKNGWVYLLRSGSFVKIGRSDQVEMRVKEITIAMPEKVEMVHAIETDDPAGIEAYWHRRFASRRMNGEWLKLDPSEVKAFKRRKYQ